MSYLDNSGPEMRALGLRLLKRNPKDVPIKYRQVTHLNGGNATEAALGLKYAQELVQMQPKEPAMYALLAFTYQNRWWGTFHIKEELYCYARFTYQNSWWGTHAKSDANDAIANYKRYMTMANLTGTKRKEVEKTIAYLQTG